MILSAEFFFLKYNYLFCFFQFEELSFDRSFFFTKKMFLILGVIVVTLIAFICAFHYKFIHTFYLSLKIDGPPALPFIGNGLLFFNNTSSGDCMNGKIRNIQMETDVIFFFNFFLLKQKISTLSIN